MCLCCVNEIAVQKLAPSALISGFDVMGGQCKTKGNRDIVIEENPHSDALRRNRLLRCAGGNVIQNSVHVFARDTGKPLEKLFDSGSAFEIHEERGYGHARPTERPDAVHSLGMALQNGASGPVEHAYSFS